MLYLLIREDGSQKVCITGVRFIASLIKTVTFGHAFAITVPLWEALLHLDVQITLVTTVLQVLFGY
jgi:hypothetical protein